MARDPDTIQLEIESARNALADNLDALGERANPKRLVESGKASISAKLAEPQIRYALMAVGALVALAVLRRMFR